MFQVVKDEVACSEAAQKPRKAESQKKKLPQEVSQQAKKIDTSPVDAAVEGGSPEVSTSCILSHAKLSCPPRLCVVVVSSSKCICHEQT